MCGICGIAGVEDRKTVALMSKAVSHRGPDASGIYSDKGVSLGHRRLAIIDLSARGKQPLANEDGTVWITFNGEIYNFQAVKRFLERHGGHDFASDSDTEVLVHAYEQWGDDFVSRLRGDFAFGLWDANEKKLLLARDFPGVCPLYYYHDAKSKRLYFTSEIKGLLAAGVPRKVNLEAVNDFLSLQYSLGPQTLFQNIFKVQPGEMVSFRKGVLKKSKYHSLPQPALERKSEREWVSEVKQRFAHSVERRLLSDVPLGVYLSGGLDSSFTAATMKSLRDEVKTFSVDFGGDSEDGNYSKLVAETLDTDHTVLRVDASDYKVFPEVAWHLDEPAADIAALPTYLMAKQAKKHVTVILTGDGGDEVFGGYARYARLAFGNKFGWALKPFKHISHRLMRMNDKARAREIIENSSDRAKVLLSYASALSEREKEEFGLPSLKSSDKTLKKMSVFFGRGRSFAKELMDFDLQTLLPDDYLMKVNKASMACGLEPRVPFLDRDFISFTQTIPPELKVRAVGFKTKVLMRKVVASTKLPKGLASRSKQGFNVPTRAWLAGELGEVAEQMLSSHARVNSFVKRDFTSSVLSNARTDERLWGKRFWTLFSLECWHRLFIDPDGVPVKPKSFKSLGG